MYNISLTKLQASELAGFLKQLSLTKAGTVESLSLLQNSIKDLTEQNKDYFAAVTELQKAQHAHIQEIMKSINELKFKRFATEDPAKQQLIFEEVQLRSSLGQEEVNAASKEQVEAVNKLGEEALVITLSDEKFEKVKSVFYEPVKVGDKEVPYALTIQWDASVVAGVGDGLTNAVKA